MKRTLLLLIAIVFILTACNATQEKANFDKNPKLESDTIRIVNDKIEVYFKFSEGLS